MRKIIALLLCLSMLAALDGCGGSKIGQYEEPEETEAPAEEAEEPEETEAPAGEAEEPEETEAPAEEAEEPEETEAPAEEAEEPEETEVPVEEAEEPEEATDDAAGASAEASDEPSDEPPAESTPTPRPLVGDPDVIYAKYDPDTVVATVNGEDVTWQEYHYYLNYFVQYAQYVALSNGFPISDWDANDFSSTSTNGQLVLMNAEDMLRQYHAVGAMAKERGIELTEDDKAQVLSIFEENADSTSGDGDGTCTEEEAAAFEEHLADQFLSRDLFDFLNEAVCLNEDMFIEEYGENGEKYPDTDALAYGDKTGVRAAKHILFMTVDQTTGQALEQAEIDEKKAKAEEVQSQLAAVADDPDALNELFDELAEEYNEDTGAAAYPGGYTYAPGVMVSEFEGAVSALPVGGLSQVVETSYGYHVIMRVAVDPDAQVMSTNGQAVSLRTAAANDAFYNEMLDAMDELDLQWTEDFESIDIGELFGPED